MSLCSTCIRLLVITTILVSTAYALSLHDTAVALDFTSSNFRALQVSSSSSSGSAATAPTAPPPLSTTTSPPPSTITAPSPAPTTKKPVKRPWMTDSGTTPGTSGTTTNSGGAVVIGVTDDATRPGYSMDTGKSTFLGFFETEKIYLMASYIIPRLDSEEKNEQEQKSGLTPKTTVLEHEPKTATFWIEEELQSWRVDLSQFDRIKLLTTTPNQRRHDTKSSPRDSIAPHIGPAQNEYWLASTPQKQLVVLKWVLADSNEMERQQDKLKYQVKRHARLKHPYVIQLIGVAWSPSTNLVVVTEYMARGDLRQWLHRTAAKEVGIWTSLKLQMLHRLALVFEYLHSFNPPLVHGNGNSRNVLLNEELEAKWSDFGGRTDEFRKRELMAYQQVGSGRWISPESLIGANATNTSSPNTSPASDIYALGMVMVEMDTHTLPFTDRPHENEMDLLELISKGAVSPTLLSTCPQPIIELVRACTAFEPSNRPSAREVVISLEAILNTGPSRDTTTFRSSI